MSGAGFVLLWRDPARAKCAEHVAIRLKTVRLVGLIDAEGGVFAFRRAVDRQSQVLAERIEDIGNAGTAAKDAAYRRRAGMYLEYTADRCGRGRVEEACSRSKAARTQKPGIARIRIRAPC